MHHTHIGCDLSKAHVDIFAAATGRHERIADTPNAIAGHLQAYRNRPVRFVFEATGCYGDIIREQLALAELAGCQVNPMRARRVELMRWMPPPTGILYAMTVL